ncbi:unnamed protein product [Brassica napus]|uniref:(rape) hypothetical protein n=1 Tax=Brassica napus TaxID=3708 RepID=A0A816JMK6_BRANA|nr:unnamed protein product [Brassica napus]
MNLILTSVVAVFKPPVTVMMMSWIIKRTYEIHVGPIPPLPNILASAMSK